MVKISAPKLQIELSGKGDGKPCEYVTQVWLGRWSSVKGSDATERNCDQQGYHQCKINSLVAAGLSRTLTTNWKRSLADQTAWALEGNSTWRITSLLVRLQLVSMQPISVEVGLCMAMPNMPLFYCWWMATIHLAMLSRIGMRHLGYVVNPTNHQFGTGSCNPRTRWPMSCKIGGWLPLDLPCKPLNWGKRWELEKQTCWSKSKSDSHRRSIVFRRALPSRPSGCVTWITWKDASGHPRLAGLCGCTNGDSFLHTMPWLSFPASASILLICGGFLK